jgi:hypothetical protein
MLRVVDVRAVPNRLAALNREHSEPAIRWL